MTGKNTGRSKIPKKHRNKILNHQKTPELDPKSPKNIETRSKMTEKNTADLKYQKTPEEDLKLPKNTAIRSKITKKTSE